jgi:hypothetical protein
MKRIFLVLFVMSVGVGIKAQSSEIGLCGGISFYMGDLNPKGVFSGSRPAGGVLYRHNINPRLAFKANVLFGSLGASDAKTGADLARNLSFRSPLSEISAQMELNFMKLYNERGMNPFTPYLFAGIAIFSFNPQAELNGKWHDLQPLGTEGQGLNIQDPVTGVTHDKKRYALTNFSIPFGIGMRVNFLRYYCIGLEWGFRKTFTDYIDDVSTTYVRRDFLIEYRSRQIADLADRTTVMTTDNEGNQFPDYHDAGTARGNNKKTKDWYSFATLSFTFKLNYTKDCGLTKAGTSTIRKNSKTKYKR